jgi:glycerol kinase
MLAGLAVGVWKSPEDLHAIVKRGDLFTPKMRTSERDTLLAGWHHAVGRVLTSHP